MIINADCLVGLSQIHSNSIQCCVTSPPYFALRNYQMDGQIGLEDTPKEYISRLVQVFREVRRVLKDDGTLWINISDSYASGGKKRTEDQAIAKSSLSGGLKSQKQSLTQQSKIVDGLKPKDLIGIPWMLAFALRDDGWYLRQEIIWEKPNQMPQSVKDRCTKSHESIFLLSKSSKYYFDHKAIQEPAICGARGSEFNKGKTALHQLGRAQKVRPSAEKGSFKAKGEPLTGQLPFRAIVDMRNKRSVWKVSTKPLKEAHFAAYPIELIEPCILAGSKEGDIILDPFLGSGTTGIAATMHGREYVGIELNPEYVEIAKKRLSGVQKVFSNQLET